MKRVNILLLKFSHLDMNMKGSELYEMKRFIRRLNKGVMMEMCKCF